MKRFVMLALFLIPVWGKAHAETYSVDAAAWQQPRSAAMVKSLPGVNAAVQALLDDPQARLVIRHQQGEEGALWGTELHDWLVSLGLPPARMRVEEGETSAAALQLEVLSNSLNGS